MIIQLIMSSRDFIYVVVYKCELYVPYRIKE